MGMGGLDSDSKKHFLIIGAILLSAFYIIAGLIPINSLWGFNHLKYFPDFVTIIYAILVIVFIIPAVADRIYILLSKLTVHFQKLPKPIRIVIISVLAGIVFYLLRVHVHSLGDGYQRIFEIGKGKFYSHTEPLDFFLHAALYRFLLLFDIRTPELSYVIISILSGLIFVNAIYLFKFSSRVNASTSLLIKTIFIASGGLLLFFGYVESYSFYYLFSLLFLLWAIKFLIDKKGLLASAILLAIAIASHITSLFLIPGFVYLFYLNIKDNSAHKFWSKYSPFLIVGLATISVVILVILRQPDSIKSATLLNLFLPLYSNSEYSILSWHHLYDILNQILLISPYCLLIAMSVITHRKTDSNKKNLFLFLMILVVSAGLFMLVIDPKLGYARDWDLFSTPAAIFGLSVGILLLIRYSKNGLSKYIAFIITVFSILFLSGWILMNSSETKQLTRAEDLLKLSEKGRGYGTELLAYYYRIYKKNNRKAIELYKGISEREKNARVYKELGKTQKKAGLFEDAKQSYYLALSKDPKNPKILNEIGLIYIDQKRDDSALMVLRYAHQMAPKFVPIFESLALAYIYNRHNDSASALADTLFMRDSNSPGGHAIKLVLAARSNDWEKARFHYQEFLKHGKGRADYNNVRDYYLSLQ